ncbi:outer membrane beta-barrel family protein [Asticcacaulis benevestitus]|uniref:outer membrane beta-barrel family protein n=1 Tax=Asticcacaulis benevestitus TaxID=347481 RepID=UPI00138AB46B|nr:outer membrane beta-barrel family protein [Asticcacaulis benevestitus]
MTVVVTGKTPPVVHKIDRSVYDLKDSAQAQTGSVGDVLNTLPSVSVSPDGSLNVRGTGSVQVLVDGKPSASYRGANLANTLQSASANGIAKVEVITNPGAEFRTNASIIINLVTKKSSGQAPAGDLVVNVGEGGRSNGSLSGSGGIGRWTFSAGLNWRHDHRMSIARTDRLVTQDDGGFGSHMNEVYRISSPFDIRVYDAGMGYAISDTDTFNLNGQVATRTRPRTTEDRIQFLDAAGKMITDSVTHGDGPQHFNSRSLTATYKHKGSHDGETLTVQARHEEDDNLQDFRFVEADTLPLLMARDYRRSRVEHPRINELSIDYIRPLGTDRQFKAGMEFEVDREAASTYSAEIDTNAGAEIVDPSQTNAFWSQQTLSAAYADYQMPLGKWTVEGGLRLESLQTQLRSTPTSPLFSTRDTEWSPSFFFSRTLSEKSKIHVSYSHRIDRPKPNQLDPTPQNLDAQDVYIGNPGLKPQQTESIEAGYDYTTKQFSFTGAIYSRQTHNSIVDYAYYRDPEDTVLVSSYENADHGAADGVSMSFDLKPKGMFRYNVSTDLYYNELEASVAGILTRHSGVSHNIKASVTFVPSRADTFQANLQLRGKALTALGSYSGVAGLDLSYSRKISPRLKLVVTAQDVLKGAHYYHRNDTPQYYDHTYAQFPSRILFVGLAYKLGAVRPSG